jgi:hypothetical protein
MMGINASKDSHSQLRSNSHTPRALPKQAEQFLGEAQAAPSCMARTCTDPVDNAARRCVEFGFQTVARVQYGADGGNIRGLNVCVRIGCESCLQ